MNQNYDELENQIGDLGGEQKPEQKITQKKLVHKASYGQQEDLNNEEKNSLDDFLKKGKAMKEKTEKENEANIAGGWIPIDRAEMGIRSQFYPESWEFSIRPATLNAIKNWTAIDEERPDVLNKVFNEIVKACVKIDTHDVNGASWGQINSWDRFWFILKVREYTFINGEAKIEFEDACSECDADITYTLTADSLFYAFPDEELIENYWNGKEWVVDPRAYDVDHDPVTLYTPKLGKDDAIINWAVQKNQIGQKVDENFLQFLVWMLNKPVKDFQMLDRQINNLYKEYKSWDLEMFSFMQDVVRNITINPSEKMRTICPSCGQEATSTVQFPNGVKPLFAVETKGKKFGTR